mmetsp:Transcript_1375/g.2079  ORF Transcript_1375/g.2079 Transcript_1375/m.2079 type:complete len:448 (-) Transcript_1375:99-1442(-)
MKGKLASCNLELISAYFDLDIQTAAQRIGVSSRSLKIACRKYGIRRWPFRRIRMVNKAIVRLHEQIDTMPVDKRPEMFEQLAFLQRQKEQLIRHGRQLDTDLTPTAVAEESGEESPFECDDKGLERSLSSGEISLGRLSSVFSDSPVSSPRGSQVLDPSITSQETPLLKTEDFQKETLKSTSPLSPSGKNGSLRTNHAHVDFALLSKFFAMTASAAAKQIGVSVTTLKKICREHGIQRWPSRKIRKMSNAITRIQGIVDDFPPTSVANRLISTPVSSLSPTFSNSSSASSVSLPCSLPTLAFDSPLSSCSPKSSTDVLLSVDSCDLSMLAAVACAAAEPSSIALCVPPKKRARCVDFSASETSPKPHPRPATPKSMSCQDPVPTFLETVKSPPHLSAPMFFQQSSVVDLQSLKSLNMHSLERDVCLTPIHALPLPSFLPTCTVFKSS